MYTKFFLVVLALGALYAHAIPQQYTLPGVNLGMGLDFSRDGAWLAAGSVFDDGSENRGLPPQLFNLQSDGPPRLQHVLNDTKWEKFNEGTLRFSGDSKWLAVAADGPGGLVSFLYALSAHNPPQRMFSFGPWADNFLSGEFGFSPDSKWFWAGAVDDAEDVFWTWQVYSLDAGGPPTLVVNGNTSRETSTCLPPIFSADSKWVIVQRSERGRCNAEVYSLKGGKATLQDSFKLVDGNQGTLFSGDSKWLMVVETWATRAHLYSLGDGHAMVQSCVEFKGKNSFSFSGDGKWLATTTLPTAATPYKTTTHASVPHHNGGFFLFPLASGCHPNLTLELKVPNFKVSDFTFSHDSQSLAVSVEPPHSEDTVAFAFFTLKSTPPTMQQIIKGSELMYSFNAQWAATNTANDHSIEVYARTQDSQLRHRFTINDTINYTRGGDPSSIQAAFSPDSKWLATFTYPAFSHPQKAQGHIYSIGSSGPPKRIISFKGCSDSRGLTDRENCMTFSRDSKWMAVLGLSGKPVEVIHFESGPSTVVV